MAESLRVVASSRNTDNTLELVILIGLPGAGKSTFYRARFAQTHTLVSKDRMRNQRDRQARQLILIDANLAVGRPVVVDNVNAAAADRAPLIALARVHGARVVGYAFQTPIDVCRARNRGRTGVERVPAVAINAAAKRWQAPTAAEGFDELFAVDAHGNIGAVASVGAPPAPTIFLLSPASTSGKRAALLYNPAASFALARQLRSAAGAPLGDVFSFCSSLYFRGKLAYARAFGLPPTGLCGGFVITPGEGLRDPNEPITLARLRAYDSVRIKLSEQRYLEPLLRDADALARLAGDHCRIVLLGSVASNRYVEPLLDVFGDRLLFPPSFVGRGDMSRGGLLLRCVADRRELEYTPLSTAVRHGPRPPRLPPRGRVREA